MTAAASRRRRPSRSLTPLRFAAPAGLYGIAFGALLGGDMGAVASTIGASGVAPVAKFCVAFPMVQVASLRCLSTLRLCSDAPLSAPAAPLIIAEPTRYHFNAGARHMYWEHFPEGLNPESQKQMSAALIGVSTVASAGIAFAL